MKLCTFALCCFVLSTFSTGLICKAETVELFPYSGQGGEKLLCALAGKTYCLNVTNYPRSNIEDVLSKEYVPLPFKNSVEDDY